MGWQSPSLFVAGILAPENMQMVAPPSLIVGNIERAPITR
jgi:hypothetical protein